MEDEWKLMDTENNATDCHKGKSDDGMIALVLIEMCFDSPESCTLNVH